MIPNNNLSILPWYNSIEQQNARKWWVYQRIYPLFCRAGYLLPWQLLLPYDSTLVVTSVTSILLIDANTGSTVGNFTADIRAGITVKQYASFGYTALVFPGQIPVFNSMDNGRYYLQMTVGTQTFYSEVFTVVNDISPYLKLTWWDTDDFVMDAGVIVYTDPAFKNIVYLPSDIAKPEYVFTEEGEERDGYFFATKQISEKRYRFNFLASEYMLDVLRFVRMADYAEIEYHGQLYQLDTFLITPEWESNGDVAVVSAEFETATVAKKIGTGYVKAMRGDYNDDFGNDYSNQAE